MPQFEHKDTDGDCTCFASLTVDGRNVILKNHTKMKGTAGTGTGIVEFYAFDSNGVELHRNILKLSVGSNAWNGIARKEHVEQYELTPNVARRATYVLRASASETSGFDGPQFVAGVIVVAALAGVVATGGTLYVLPLSCGGICIGGFSEF
jgi:hypothetical protein